MGGPEGKDDEGCVDAGKDEGAEVEVGPADARRDNALADEGRAEGTDRWKGRCQAVNRTSRSKSGNMTHPRIRTCSLTPALMWRRRTRY